MQLKRLQGLEREKLAERSTTSWKSASRIYRELLSNEEMLKGVLKDELIAIRDKYGDDRRTEIQDVEDEIDIEDLIEEEQCVFTLSPRGLHQARPGVDLPQPEARRPRRDGHDARRRRTSSRASSPPRRTTISSSSRTSGKVHRRKGYQIPEAGTHGQGHESSSTSCPSSRARRSRRWHHACMSSTRIISSCSSRRTAPSSVWSCRALQSSAKTASARSTLDEGDELIAVMKTDGKQDIMLATRGRHGHLLQRKRRARHGPRRRRCARHRAGRRATSVVGAGIAARGQAAALRHRDTATASAPASANTACRGAAARVSRPTRSRRRPARSSARRRSPARRISCSYRTTARSSAWRPAASRLLGRATQGVRLMRPGGGRARRRHGAHRARSKRGRDRRTGRERGSDHRRNKWKLVLFLSSPC